MDCLFIFMNRILLILIFVFVGIKGIAQKRYRCEFADILTMKLPDSTLRNMSKMSNQDIELTPEMMEQIYIQLKTSLMAMYQLRIVKANEEETIVSIDKSSIK